MAASGACSAAAGAGAGADCLDINHTMPGCLLDALQALNIPFFGDVYDSKLNFSNFPPISPFDVTLFKDMNHMLATAQMLEEVCILHPVTGRYTSEQTHAIRGRWKTLIDGAFRSGCSIRYLLQAAWPLHDPDISAEDSESVFLNLVDLTCCYPPPQDAWALAEAASMNAAHNVGRVEVNRFQLPAAAGKLPAPQLLPYPQLVPVAAAVVPVAAAEVQPTNQYDWDDVSRLFDEGQGVGV